MVLCAKADYTKHAEEKPAQVPNQEKCDAI
jgi:hypothetical protein